MEDMDSRITELADEYICMNTLVPSQMLGSRTNHVIEHVSPVPPANADKFVGTLGKG
jgi:hypothetical protein